eukprot:CAMPEP_0116868080 /NCGR_PEP_ID=MMETSP0418-20121206/26986_1 /TAXON_ID=1158023 /ORGANISM="Astrosyne radiata, Strain 13vi08-1A" /LENGTH=205 /DNA_ID=CAMNT_0004503987 /DNA_START=46 /DNA_END=660 /DNA_ORIENTATION=+
MTSQTPDYQKKFSNFLANSSRREDLQVRKIRAEFDKKARKAIKADKIRMVAATKDNQKAKGLKWSRLGIPDAKGRPRPGGALTAEMLSLLRENHDNPNPEEKLTWVSALSRCRATLREKALARRREALSAQENDQQVQVQVQVQVPQEPQVQVQVQVQVPQEPQEPQEPQLSSSRMIDVNEPLHIIPPRSNGKRRAVIIGINYVG